MGSTLLERPQELGLISKNRGALSRGRKMNVFSTQRRKTKVPSLGVPAGRDLVKQAGEGVSRSPQGGLSRRGKGP